MQNYGPAKAGAAVIGFGGDHMFRADNHAAHTVRIITEQAWTWGECDVFLVRYAPFEGELHKPHEVKADPGSHARKVQLALIRCARAHEGEDKVKRVRWDQFWVYSPQGTFRLMFMAAGESWSTQFWFKGRIQNMTTSLA